MKHLDSSPEQAEIERNARRYIWGIAALVVLLLAVIVGAAFLLHRR